MDSTKNDLMKAQLPYYRCHKIVRAGFIVDVGPADFGNCFALTIQGLDEPILVSREFDNKHAPRPGTYYVLYEDGYQSISPAEAFEAGYREIDTVSMVEIEAIAEKAHEMNRQYCEAIGDTSQLPWHEAPMWQKESCINGVKFTLESLDSTPEDSHTNWFNHKLADGWKWGPVKDVDKKEHPCMVPFDDLPPEQRFKDTLFRETCKAGFAALGVG